MAIIKLIEGGPAIIQPDDEESLIVIDDKETIAMKKVALCRCGKSEKYPFCDGRHKDLGV